MKTLVIYDDSGVIFLQISGTYILPSGGINYLEVEIPSDKILSNVNVTMTPHSPVFADVPKTKIEVFQERLEEQENALIELASMLGGVQ